MSTDLRVKIGAFITAKQRTDPISPYGVQEHLCDTLVVVDQEQDNPSTIVFISNHIDMLNPSNEAGYHVCDTVYIGGEMISFLAEHKEDIDYLRTQYDDVQIVFGVVSYWA